MRKTRVFFKAIKIGKKPVKVDFYVRDGRKVEFKKSKDIPKPIKVEFYQRENPNQ